MRLRNINPVSPIELPLIGKVLAHGDEFTVTAEQGEVLLSQTGNYEQVEEAPKTK